ncbi:hypothetical protein ACHAXN_006231 [Cyclotella atomus]
MHVNRLRIALTTSFIAQGRINLHLIPLNSLRRGILVKHAHSHDGSVDRCLLDFNTGPYTAAEVSSSTLEQCTDDDEFLNKLKQSINFWKDKEYTSAWINVPVSRARLIESLSDEPFGFDLHHTNATQQTIIMKKWLNENKEDLIPPFATHQVGCAGFVLNDNNELLLIKEWTGPLSASRTPSKQWKLPGGLLDAGESFEEAVIREVHEETGVPCDFEGILSFWHRHGLKWGKSDLYYVCLLKPRSLQIEVCPVEISDACWMHVNDFLEKEDHPLITHVLKRAYLLDKNNTVDNDCAVRIQPQSIMATGSVQWPGRSPYPTYTSHVTKE